jgi:anhydro-N-acetylmuramic acid kinase
MQGLRDRLGDCRAAGDLGLRSDFVEAEAMASWRRAACAACR